MKCNQIRDRLTAGGDAGASATHLESCAACARFAARLQTARELFRDPGETVLPDERFAIRVAARLGAEHGSTLGWAAVRLLPATLAVLFALAVWSWQAAPDPSALFEDSPTDDLLAWVVDRAGADR
jgi:hypothetical protein